MAPAVVGATAGPRAQVLSAPVASRDDTPEEVAARNPDVIVFSVSDDAHERQVRDYLRNTFPDVTAVAEDRLVPIPAADLFPGALGNVTAVETIAAELYPGRS